MQEHQRVAEDLVCPPMDPGVPSVARARTRGGGTCLGGLAKTARVPNED